VAGKINGNRGTQQEISVSTKVSKKIYHFNRNSQLWSVMQKMNQLDIQSRSRTVLLGICSSHASATATCKQEWLKQGEKERPSEQHLKVISMYISGVRIWKFCNRIGSENFS